MPCCQTMSHLHGSTRCLFCKRALAGIYVNVILPLCASAHDKLSSNRFLCRPKCIRTKMKTSLEMLTVQTGASAEDLSSSTIMILFVIIEPSNVALTRVRDQAHIMLLTLKASRQVRVGWRVATNRWSICACACARACAVSAGELIPH